MKIIGIHDGHDASVALMVDGKIIFAAQEERFSRLKGDYGFPKRAVEEMFKFSGLKPSEIDLVTVGSFNLNPVLLKLKRNAQFSVADWIDEQEKFWKPKIFFNKKVNYWKIFRKRFKKFDKYYNYKNFLKGYMNLKELKRFRFERLNSISKHLKIKKNKIKFVLHEDCHKYYSFYFFPERKDGIAITSEGIGDYSNGSVSIVKKNKFYLKAYNRENHLGHIYQYITLLLGMKPNQHEYKVMGLAPYTSNYEIEKCYKIFDKILKVKGLNIVFDKKPKDLFYHFKEKLINCRFDGIAGALQKFLEKKLETWFVACFKKFRYRNFYFSGGVAQNIKAALYLSKNKKIKKIFVPPAAGDSTISIGACFYGAANSFKNEIHPINSMYLGTSLNTNEIKRLIKKKLNKKFIVKSKFSAREVAIAISKGAIIGRCAGRMEFGLRSLGNRSILCDPRFSENINKINFKIKKRDFWMPFTPTILKEDFDKYIINPKKIEARFMSMAFETTNIGRNCLKAAIHPADFTARPQLLSKDDNPKYFEIIKSFKQITGVGALLNTSLNLHGLPVVRNAEDALYVFENSGLDFLILENFLLKKK